MPTDSASTGRPSAAAPAAPLPPPDPSAHASGLPNPATLLRAAVGGLLIGVSTLVPGLSSGAMLLVAGVYPRVVQSVAELTSLKFRLGSILFLGTIALCGGTMVLFLAGLVVGLVAEHRWIMYSLFFGLSLGGGRLLARKARPFGPGSVLGVALGVAIILAVRWLMPDGGRGDERNYVMTAIAGIAAATAVLTPGLDGNSLLLGLGYYEILLGAVHEVRVGLLGGDGQEPSLGIFLDALHVCIPFGLGVLLALALVSHVMRWLLARHRRGVLAVLLGLLLGTLINIYPFQRGVPPRVGDRIGGVAITEANLAEIEAEDWNVEYFKPTLVQVAMALGLIVVGFGITELVGLLDTRADSDDD